MQLERQALLDLVAQHIHENQTGAITPANMQVVLNALITSALLPASDANGFDPLVQLTTDATRAYADVVLRQPSNLAAVEYLYNANGLQLQALKPDQTTWGGVRTTLAALNADLTTAWATTPTAVIVRVSPTRLVTTEVCHVLLTLQLL